jgi:hypothetical protein
MRIFSKSGYRFCGLKDAPPKNRVFSKSGYRFCGLKDAPPKNRVFSESGDRFRAWQAMAVKTARRP